MEANLIKTIANDPFAAHPETGVITALQLAKRWQANSPTKRCTLTVHLSVQTGRLSIFSRYQRHRHVLAIKDSSSLPAECGCSIRALSSPGHALPYIALLRGLLRVQPAYATSLGLDFNPPLTGMEGPHLGEDCALEREALHDTVGLACRTLDT